MIVLIKNVVFDLCGVLIEHDIDNFLKFYDVPVSEIEFYKQIIFKCQEWKDCNKGIYSATKVKEILIKKYPEYQSKLEDIFNHFNNAALLSEKKSTTSFLKELKSRGLRIYILSDLPEINYDYSITMEWAKYIDGKVISFEIGTLKPNDNNYLTLLNKYQLVPEETIFIDDRLVNIEKANVLGIHGVQFTDIDAVRKKVFELLKNNVN